MARGLLATDSVRLPKGNRGWVGNRYFFQEVYQQQYLAPLNAVSKVLHRQKLEGGSIFHSPIWNYKEDSMHRCYRYHQSRIRCQGGVGDCMFNHSTIDHSGKAERNLVRLLLFLPLPFASKISPLPPVPTLALANFRPCLCLDILSIRSTWSKTCSCNGDNNI